MKRTLLVTCSLALIGGILGCSDDKPKAQTIEIKAQDPMDQVKATLMNYVNGQPLGSEVTAYDFMIEAVTKANPEKGAILKAGLEELKNVKGKPGPKAAELLKKLGLEVAAPAAPAAPAKKS